MRITRSSELALADKHCRAMLVGGGVMAALDGRSPDAVAAKTGGILQLAQYLVGLSGGSWMTGSWALANFPSFECAFTVGRSEEHTSELQSQ